MDYTTRIINKNINLLKLFIKTLLVKDLNDLETRVLYFANYCAISFVFLHPGLYLTTILHTETNFVSKINHSTYSMNNTCSLRNSKLLVDVIREAPFC